MSNDLGREELNELKGHFERFDRDRNGYIDFAEFGELIRSLGEDPDDAVMELNFAAIDKNEDGVVNFLEFSRWWLDR